MIQEVVRVLSFLLPVPFMALYFVKTDKLDFMKDYMVLAFFVPVFLRIIARDYIGYSIELIMSYTIFVIVGTVYFNKKNYTFLKSLSIAFCLVYFSSFLWEVPYHIYTIFVRGGIDGAFPLHMLFVFPILFVYEKVQTNLPLKKILKVLFAILGFSTAIMLGMILNGYDIWIVDQNPMGIWIKEEMLWMITRIVAVAGLFVIYSESTLRKKMKKDGI